MYEYLLGTLLNGDSVTELQQGAASFSAAASLQQHGTFITGPSNESREFTASQPAPVVYVFNEGRCQQYHLVVYRASKATLCLLFAAPPSTIETYNELHTFIGPQLLSISGEIDDFVVQQLSVNAAASQSNGNAVAAATAAGPRFLFFNEMNMKHTGTLYVGGVGAKTVATVMKQSYISPEVMNLLADLYEPTRHSNAPAEETVVKTLNDYWIVKRTANWRHFYVIINRSATLLEVTEEARRLFDEHARNVFFNK